MVITVKSEMSLERKKNYTLTLCKIHKCEKYRVYRYISMIDYFFSELERNS